MAHSPVRDFSQSFATEIEARLSPHMAGEKVFAAFDADGTLWDTDVGENFFEYQIEKCNLLGMPRDPLKHYLDMKVTNRIGAYYWLAQINKGQKLSQVHQWAEEALAGASLPILKSNQKIVEFLQKNGVEIFVVTASVKWAVEPAAALLGIDRDHVLGFQTEVVDGVVTDKPLAPATYREGKAAAVLAATGGIAPIFCAGNTIGDVALLSCSSAVSLAVRTQSRGELKNSLLEDELILESEALKRNWLTHAFRS